VKWIRIFNPLTRKSPEFTLRSRSSALQIFAPSASSRIEAMAPRSRVLAAY